MPNGNKIIRSRDVIFNEARVYKDDSIVNLISTSDPVPGKGSNTVGETTIIMINTPQVTQGVQTVEESHPGTNRDTRTQRHAHRGWTTRRMARNPPNTAQFNLTMHHRIFCSRKELPFANLPACIGSPGIWTCPEILNSI